MKPIKHFLSLSLALSLLFAAGCSDKTQTAENKALTKQRQDKIAARKNGDDLPAASQDRPSQDRKSNSGD